MQEILDGWMFQPGKVRGVRWTIHQAELEGGSAGALVLTNSVFQLLAGTRMRSVTSLQLKAGYKSDYIRNPHGTEFYFVASGIVRFYTDELDWTSSAPTPTEEQVLYPAHGVVVPAGVIHAVWALSDAGIIFVSDEEEQSVPEIVAPHA